MDVTATITGSFASKNFPWRRRGVAVPVADRRSAALGICMFTASKKRALFVQQVTFWGVRLLGTWSLPGRREHWLAPYPTQLWADLMEQCESRLGRFDAMSVYYRRQTERPGFTALLTHRGQRVAVLKVRDDSASIQREQEALEAVAAIRPTTFHAPKPLGFGSVAENLHWSAQTAVFDHPHHPVFEVPDLLFDEVASVLACAPGQDPARAHNDLTPWNLRRDRSGGVWLFDWEDWGPAPPGSDRVYFHATSTALSGRRMPSNLPPAAIKHWDQVLSERIHRNPPDLELHQRIVGALDQVRERVP